jgi:dTMP kinase
MAQGIFITFEGPEGSGKSTHAKRLINRLEQGGREVLALREPGGTPAGDAIRSVVQHDGSGADICGETEVFLFGASRAELVAGVIRPALERGAWVVCDRFMDSTVAYQGYARGVDPALIKKVNAAALSGTLPDVTIFLDIHVADGLGRVQQRGQGTDRIEQESEAFHQRVREGYHAIMDAEPDRFICIETDEPADSVHERIWKALEARLGDRLA